MRKASKPLALQLCGSVDSTFYYELSLIYASELICPPGWTNVFLVVQPNGQWRFGLSLDDLGEPESPKSIMGRLPDVDLVVPQMFCRHGMVTFRALFETVLNQPIVGSPARVTALAVDKAETKRIVSAAGVRVAPGEVVSGEAPPILRPPLIVKPNREDNSLGVTLVEQADDLPTAVRKARDFDEAVLVEKFIAGRELRVAVIEQPDGYLMPAMIEYLVDRDNPIRTTNDKLTIGHDGSPTSQAMASPVEALCPARVEPELREAVRDQAIRAHRALGARHYSLFDFRICSDSGQPFFLEAGLFWSFSRNSMITRMIASEDRDVEAEIDRVWRSAASL